MFLQQRISNINRFNSKISVSFMSKRTFAACFMLIALFVYCKFGFFFVCNNLYFNQYYFSAKYVDCKWITADITVDLLVTMLL